MINDIENWPELLRVERPGRYVGGEPGAAPNEIRDGAGRLLRVVLSFPDVYEIAHGHLGHKILYSLINGRPGLSAERAYAPWRDWEEVLRRRRRPLTSLESGRPLHDFDVVGFSLQYELGYTNILNMLALGGLPLAAGERGHGSPLVVAGGPGAMNPEPLADFFDVFFLGDAERSFLEDLEIIKVWRHEGAPKRELWERLAGRPGLYIPSLFEPRYGPGGFFASMTPLKDGYRRVERAAAGSLEAAPFPRCQITPLIKPVHDRIAVEIGRGCSRGCRFCQAGYIYRPVRERRRETVLGLVKSNLEASGQDEVSFLSLSAGDHSQIGSLVSGFMDEHASGNVALSLPSLRVKSLSGHLARQIRRVRKTGFTLAPEAGSQRLRDVVNKDLTDEDLFAAADQAFSLGWRVLKLYFMVGLPTETAEDIEAIAVLTRRLRKMSRARLNLGIAHFTPKAHTPFQWRPAAATAEINERLTAVRAAVRAPGLTPRWNEPGASWVESILARGDRRLGRVLRRVHEAGARFEAWGDCFDPKLWEAALAAENLSGDFLLRPFGPEDALPYDHLFAGVNKDFLLKELERAHRAETTADCRWDKCLGCGACHGGAAIDLAEPAASAAASVAEPSAASVAASTAEASEKIGFAPGARRQGPEAVFLINFKKEGRIAFLGHLELVELFKRAFRRAGLELAVSAGFHPQPKLSFLTALPLGVPSQDEYLRVVVRGLIGADDLADRLRARLPGDVAVKGARLLAPGEAKLRPGAVTWRLSCPGPVFKPGPPPCPEAALERVGKKGRQGEYRLADFVIFAEAAADSLTLTIRTGAGGTPKPAAAAAALWGLEPEALSGARLCKLETILESPRGAHDI
ncbi:MAG: TIGR03960 family B12-binding radical SAM protein [Candidatus Adiutrix sp.]|jgi:radical SAM family uncharacterized protein/radical SAM-linked protein|nr:TIGR03960 family B12-binding radical SAM protein [Candidatus Adiutrix sp.]